MGLPSNWEEAADAYRFRFGSRLLVYVPHPAVAGLLKRQVAETSSFQDYLEEDLAKQFKNRLVLVLLPEPMMGRLPRSDSAGDVAQVVDLRPCPGLVRALASGNAPPPGFSVLEEPRWDAATIAYASDRDESQSALDLFDRIHMVEFRGGESGEGSPWPDASTSLVTDSIDRTIDRDVSTDLEVDLGAVEADAIATAFAAAGLQLGSRLLPSGQLQLGSLQEPVLGALALRTQEDSIIEHDSRVVPGFVKQADFVAGRLFRDESRSLLVLNINRQPLETATGADLIYWNQEYRACTLVQYKMLKSDGEDGWRVSLDRHARKQVRALLRIQHRATASVSENADAFRTHDGVFFKLCPRQLSDVTDGTLIDGRYVPARLLRSKPFAAGLSFGSVNAGRGDYLRRWWSNDLFLSMLRDAWVGVSTPSDRTVGSLLARLLNHGHAVTFAVSNPVAPDED